MIYTAGSKTVKTIKILKTADQLIVAWIMKSHEKLHQQSNLVPLSCDS